MSLTALVWLSLYCAAILAALSNPIFGALGYLLEYYRRPELNWWGDELPLLRWNLIISVTLGVTFLMRRNSMRQMQRVPNPALFWMSAMAVIMTIVTFTVAVDSDTSWHWAVQWMKTALVFPLLLVGVIRTRTTFDLFVAANMLGAFSWGYDAWINPDRDAGRLLNVGSGDTLNDNGAAAHLLTVLPFAAIYLLTEKDKRLRLIALLALPFVLNTFILCNSRGATVGLLAAVLASVFLIRSGYRLRLLGAGLGFIAILYVLADPRYIARQQSTADYQEDSSAQQRLQTWQGALDMVQDRPFGAGGRGFHRLSPVYIPEVVAQHVNYTQRAPHNTIAMVATEWGVLGLVCYVGWYGSAFLMLRRVKARSTPADREFYWRALALQLAIVGFLIAGVFTDRLYAEAGYWMIGLSVALNRIQRTDQVAGLAPRHVATTNAPAEAPWQSKLAPIR